MTSPKYVATSLKKVLEHPVTKVILNREENIMQAIDTVLSWWDYDLMKRKPSPAYNEYGIFKGTDLDLACFLYALSSRGAIIELPEYKAHTQTKIREGEQLISKKNRHGQLVNVGGNKNFFSFNVTIIDQNVVKENQVGDFRTFSLTDKNGDWYDGWKEIKFVPTLKENQFITENKLSWIGNRIIFTNFIHPNRWTSVFGHHYIITRLLMDRLDDEAAFINTEIKRLQTAGVTFPEGKGPAPYVPTKYGATRSETFTAFEMRVYIPKTKIQGDYTFLDETQNDLIRAYGARKAIVYNLLPKLRFMTRASEFAHFKAQDRFPHWLQGVKWEDGFKIPRGRTTYQRLKLFQDKVGEQSISLLRRTYQKSATVSAD